MGNRTSPVDDYACDDFARPVLGGDWAVCNGDVCILESRDLGLLTRNAPMHGLGIVEWRGATFGADQFSETMISPLADRKALFQVFVRRTEDGHRFGFHWDVADGGHWELKGDGLPGAPSLATVPAPPPEPGDVIRIEAVGNVLTGYHNGKQVISAVDEALAALPGPGRPGLVLQAYWVQSVPAAYYRRWTGGGLRRP